MSVSSGIDLVKKEREREREGEGGYAIMIGAEINSSSCCIGASFPSSFYFNTQRERAYREFSIGGFKYYIVCLY